jgi:DNA (cytosine-5)-methyltransferase 1
VALVGPGGNTLLGRSFFTSGTSQPAKHHPMRKLSSLELFAGAGGLALGISKAGMKHKFIAEKNGDSCATLRANKQFYANCEPVELDLSAVDPSKLVPDGVDVIAGGPPCQPFSQGGSGKGAKDTRNLFPVAFQFIQDLQPKAFIIENVKGLAQERFANYLEYLRLQLQYPSLHPEKETPWKDQLQALEDHHSSNKQPEYLLFCRTMNAADFGVAQKRERFFMVGFRYDICDTWHFPSATHSRQALLKDQQESGQYWERHEVPKKDRRISTMPKHWERQSEKPNSPYRLLPWQTVRDAIGDLPTPTAKGDKEISNHESFPGARIYDGHTGSYIDNPSKTIKAGAHGVPGGENTIVFPNGKFRYYTMRECARIQSFPDDYTFSGSRSAITKQIGNAVPPTLARIVAESVVKTLAIK